LAYLDCQSRLSSCSRYVVSERASAHVVAKDAGSVNLYMRFFKREYTGKEDCNSNVQSRYPATSFLHCNMPVIYGILIEGYKCKPSIALPLMGPLYRRLNPLHSKDGRFNEKEGCAWQCNNVNIYL